MDEDDEVEVDTINHIDNDEMTPTRVDVDRLLSDVGAFGRLIKNVLNYPEAFQT